MKASIVLPVYNEEEILAQSVKKIYSFCQKNLKDDWQIVISDNASTDQTAKISQELIKKYPLKVFYLYQKVKGKGAAIRGAWQNYPADIYIFMDADLATDLVSLPTLIEELKKGNDLVVGSRFLSGSQVERALSRKIISWGYSFLARKLLGLKVKDAPCGFKAVNKIVVQNLLPQVENNFWFFDSELLARGQKAAYKIKEMPVQWRESQRKSRVKTLALILDYSFSLLKLRKKLTSIIKK